MLVIDWANVSSDMMSWLQTIGADLVVVKNYKSSELSKDICTIRSVKSIYFYNPIDPPSIRLQKTLTTRKIDYSINSVAWDERQADNVYLRYDLMNKRAIWFSSYNKYIKF